MEIYPVPREWQDEFCNALARIGFDCYGTPEQWDDDLPRRFNPDLGSHLDKYEREINGQYYAYDTEVFTVMPYYWGDDDDIAALPNFVYKPTGFTLRWYKYALRDAYMSHDVTLAELLDMLGHCAASITREAA